ncbi:unnamed protein product [Effrenium voratum]|nr:unnamed protein product [Effrenium voratum]
MAVSDVSDLFRLIDASDAAPGRKRRTGFEGFSCCKRRRVAPRTFIFCELVLNEDELTARILGYASPGALQMLGMTNKLWQKRSYALASAVQVDMNSWPFALTELRDARKIFRLELSSLDELDGFKEQQLKDSKVTDADLSAALRRFGSTQVAGLVLSSSKLSSSATSQALATFHSNLQESCGV